MSIYSVRAISETELHLTYLITPSQPQTSQSRLGQKGKVEPKQVTLVLGFEEGTKRLSDAIVSCLWQAGEGGARWDCCSRAVEGDDADCYRSRTWKSIFKKL
jgi:hypothetical protein